MLLSSDVTFLWPFVVCASGRKPRKGKVECSVCVVFLLAALKEAEPLYLKNQRKKLMDARCNTTIKTRTNGDML